MKQYILGLDAGTSVVKAALFDQTGGELAAIQRRTTLQSPRPGWSEVSMEQTWSMACAAIRGLLTRHQIPGEQIAAVGVTGNMVGAWLIASDGRPLRNAILWNDNRTQELIDRLSARFPGFMSTIFQTSGSVMQQGCTLPVMRWLAEHEPHTLERAAAVLCCKDWICFKLTGSLQVDPTEASVMPGDTRKRGYSEAMFDLFGLRPYRHLFPLIVPSDQIIGGITPEAARETGLHPGTPVVAGAGDVPASAIGLGAVTPGVACTLLGTNILNCLVVSKPLFEPPDMGLLFVLPGGHWLRTMVNVSGTTSLDWFINQFCQQELSSAPSSAALFVQLEELARSSPPGANGVIYLPYLSMQGITVPYCEPAARAEFFGLTDQHQRADLLRAVYEGLALSIRDGYAQLPLSVSEIRLAGGGARSRFWSQIIADCTGKRVIIPEGSEFGARGVALLAAVALGWYASLEEAVAITGGESQIIEPDSTMTAVYDDSYEVYCLLRDSLRPAWRHAAAINAA